MVITLFLILKTGTQNWTPYLVTENFMPSGLSSSEAAILANQIGTELKIDNIWSVFGNYWGPNPNSMRAAYNRGMDQKKTIPFLEKVMPAIRG